MRIGGIASFDQFVDKQSHRACVHVCTGTFYLHFFRDVSHVIICQFTGEKNQSLISALVFFILGFHNIKFSFP